MNKTDADTSATAPASRATYKPDPASPEFYRQ